VTGDKGREKHMRENDWAVAFQAGDLGRLQQPDGRGLVYLLIAAFLLFIALRLLRRALAPIGVLVSSVAAVIFAGIAIAVALALVGITAMAGG
jgi:hypothetical protein